MAITRYALFKICAQLLVLSFVAGLGVLGCASPTDSTPTASESDLQPWTPTRKGQHPGQLQGSPKFSAADHDHKTSAVAGGPVGATMHIFWRLYSNTLSRQMGDSCRFSPSCSRFAVKATAAGPIALPLTFARLQRGHLDDGSYELDPQGYLIDSPSHYFFWRSDLGLDAHRSTMPEDHAWYVFIRATDKLPESFFDE